MTRKILAIAAALLAAPMLFVSAAEACISCEYVPEVLHSSSHSYEPQHYTQERASTPEREHSARPAKRTVEKEAVAKTVEVAKTAPIETQAENENSTISAAAKISTTETAKVEPKAAQTENSSISLASTEVAATEKAPVAATAKEAAVKSVDCKKFFPSVGMTLTVPCE